MITQEPPGAGEGTVPQDTIKAGGSEPAHGNGEGAPPQEPGGQDGPNNVVDFPRAGHRANWVDLTRLPPEPPPREWILPGFIPAGRITLLYGLGGVGKTIFAFHLAVCLVMNLLFLGRKLARNSGR